MEKNRVGFAFCGSFCTFDRVIKVMERLVDDGYEITPIMSFNAYALDTKFGTAQSFRDRIEAICKRPIIATIPAAEPIGPQKLFDILVVAPCTGNTLAKLAHGITDTPVTMAVKSHLRGGRPVVIAIASNDALAGSASNIGTLLNRKRYYFVPFEQDDSEKKPRSMVADMEKIPEAIKLALDSIQIQPILSVQ